MKRVAFFIALMVGLNATAVVRKPDEEEGQAVLLKEEDDSTGKNKTSIIHHFTQNLMTYFYAITKDGRLDIISWDRISQIFSMQRPDNKKDNQEKLNHETSWFLMNYEIKGNNESVDYEVLKK